MKLQSMTDYVLAEKLMLNIKGYEKDFISKTFNYANFLKQPLTLGMFIPTDDNGNILDEDCTDGEGYILDKIMHDEFQQAKYRVIFEGFEFYNIDDNYNGICNKENKHVFWFNKVKGWYTTQGIKTIEDIIDFEIIITENAVKKYGL